MRDAYVSDRGRGLHQHLVSCFQFQVFCCVFWMLLEARSGSVVDLRSQGLLGHISTESLDVFVAQHSGCEFGLGLGEGGARAAIEAADAHDEQEIAERRRRKSHADEQTQNANGQAS